MSPRQDPRLRERDGSADLAVVCWMDLDADAKSTSHPLPLMRALAVAQAYSTFFPRQRYWVEPVAWLVRPDAL